MATRKDLTDRGGKSRDMVKRSFRVTDTENDKLNRLLAQTGLTLRDLMAYLIEKEFDKLNKTNTKQKGDK